MSDKALGFYLRIDPYSGWTVYEVNQYGNERFCTNAMTLEDAMRQFQTQVGRPVEMRLVII